MWPLLYGSPYDSRVLILITSQLRVLIVDTAGGQVQSKIDIFVQGLVNIDPKGRTFETGIFYNTILFIEVTGKEVPGRFTSPSYGEVVLLDGPIAGDKTQPIGALASVSYLLIGIKPGKCDSVDRIGYGILQRTVAIRVDPIEKGPVFVCSIVA